MTTTNKTILWNLLSKYDNTLVSFCDSLSNVIQGKDTDSDISTIFFSYNEIDSNDVKLLDKVIGNKIIMSINS